MQRISWIVFRMFFSILTLIIQLAKLSKPKNRDYQKAYELIRQRAKKVIKVANVDLDIRGVENIPEEDGFIFYPNHQGLFDVPVFLASSTKRFAFVIKKESSNIILLKQVVESLGSLPMDRQDIKQSMGVIKEVARRVQGGDNFLIFPEGTRSRNGNKLIDFKAGSFKAAVNAKCPIVPCALIDSFKPFDEKGLQRKKVALIYLQPISYEEYKDMRSYEIAELVKKNIENAIDEYIQEQSMA